MSNANIIVTTIRQRIEELSTSKVLERKKGIDSFKDYLLCDDEVVKFLNETSSGKKDTVRWDNVFKSVTECLILAVDGPNRTKKTTQDVIMGAKNLIWVILSKANSQSYTFVSSTKLLSFIFEIWETDHLRSELEDFCTTLIMKEILEKEIYWSGIGADRWAALAEIAFDLHAAHPQDSKTSLTILLLILKHGTCYSPIALTLKKKIFTFLVDLLEVSGDLTDNDFLTNNLVSYLTFLSTELGTECKAALCKAGEHLLPRLVRLIYQKQKIGPTLPIVAHLYRALLTQFQAHHPLGIDCRGSLFAADADKWRDILKQVYYMIEREISRLQKSKEVECNSNFVHLSVHLIAWFYDEIEDFPLGDVTVDLDTTSRSKRIKLTVFRIEHLVELLQQSSSPYDMWPVLHLIASLVFRYPKLITGEEYVTLLQMLSEYQRNNFTSKERIMEFLYEAFFSFLLALDHVTLPGEIAQSVHQIWTNVFLNTNKVIGLNQCVRSMHLLLRYLLSHRPELCQPDQLIQSFTDKIVSPNDESLQTLFYLVSKVQTNTETRLKLLEWLQGLDSISASTEQLYAATMIILCTNAKPAKLETDSSELDHFFAFLKPSSLEYLYAANNFDQGLFTNNCSRVNISVSNSLYDFIDTKQVIFNEVVLKRMNEGFNRSIAFMSKDLSKEFLDVNAITSILKTLSSWICFCKYFQYLPPQSGLKESLRNVLPDALSSVLLKLSHLNLVSISLHSTFSNLFHSLNQTPLSLVTAVQDNVIGTYISAIKVNQLPSGNILESVMPVNTYPKEMKDLNFHKLSISFSDKQLKIFRHIILLTQYACNQSGVLVQSQELVISELLKTAESYLCSGFKNMHLLSSTLIIDKVLRMERVDDASMELCVQTYLDMCQTWSKQSDVVEHALLPLLHRLLCKVRNAHARFREILLSYLTNFYKLMTKNSFGASVQMKIVECFGLLSEIDPNIEWALSCADWLTIREELDIDIQPLILEMLAFLRSPFHAVRIEAIKYLPFILQSSTSKILDTTMNVDKMFQLVTRSVEEILLLDDNFTESEYVDEAVNRTASFLHAVACVISTCPIFSRQLLTYTFVMFVKKKLNVNLFRKLLFLILKDMNVTLKQLLSENIGYILTSWYDTFKSFQSFPCNALSLDVESFFKGNLSLIVTILYVNKNTREIDHYGKLVSKDVNALVSMALPKILALREDMILSSEKIVSSQLLKNRLEAIVLELLCNVSDYKHLNIKACVPHPCATDITFVRLKSQLELLRRKLDLEDSPIEYLCQNQPASIQRIHLHLSRYIFEARSFEFQIEALHRYEIFLQLLKPVLNQPEDLILDFIIHSVVTTLLHSLSSSVQNEDSSNIVLTCLNSFLHDILPQCSHILVTLLPSVVGSLIPLTQQDSELKKKSLSIIDFLVVRHCNQLREGILSLDPFPQLEEYKTISQVYNNFRGYLPCSSFSKEIRHFVEAGASSPQSRSTQQCRLQGLHNVNHLLTHKRKDLNIFNSSALSDFDLKKLEKMMNKLIIVLSELARSEIDEISNKAIECLGKIGPYCMNATVLAENTSQANDSADLMLTKMIASSVIPYLWGNQVKVVSMASESLFHLLDTPEGQTILGRLTPLERKLIYPLLPTQRKADSKISLEDLFDDRKFKELIDVTGLWVPNTPMSHDQWIAHLTSSLMSCFEKTKCYMKYLIDLCTIKTDFAETILKYLVYFIIRISSKTNEVETILSNRMSYFFSCLHRSLSMPDQSSSDIHLNKKSVKCLLDVVHFVRMHQDSPDKHLLRLNHLHVAQAALYCSAPYSAILFCHFACDQLSSTLGDRYISEECLSAVDFICNQSPEEGATLQEVLRAAYTEVDDLDSVLGCGNSHLIEMSSRIGYYKNANQWHRVLECSDILMTVSPNNEQSNLRKQMKTSLGKTGLYFIQTQITSDTPDFDACWRLSQWDYPGTMTEESWFEQCHYKALKCLHQGETVQCLNHVQAARKSMVHLLCLTDMECTKQVQSVLSKLQMIQEIEEFTQNGCEVVTKWQNNQFIGDVEFELIEPILSQRCVLLKESNTDPGTMVPYYLDIARKARMENHFHIAQRILTSIYETSLSNLEKLEVQFEQSQLFWERSELEVARVSLRMLLPRMQEDAACVLLYAQALRTYGCWQASTKCENLGSVIRKYFEPALKLLPEDQVQERLKTYSCLAKYADDKQNGISEILENKSKEQRVDVPTRSAIEIKQQVIDARELQTHQSERKTYLTMAMEFYIKSLAEGDLIDIKVFRVVSLWLGNSEDEDLLDMVATTILRVPSYKFVKVLPQLVARISNVQTKQNMLILQVIEKCALDHPHHTLPLIMAVANSLKDEIYLKKAAKAMPAKSSTMDARIKGAEFLLMKLKKQEARQNDNYLEIIRQQEVLSLAYIIFANNFLGEARTTASKFTIPSSQQLMKIKDFDRICVSTLSLKLRKEGVYSNIVGVHKFDRSYSIPGGVNEPKRITCIGTDGHKYIQLLKGKDDPRQDAVMQQVFTILNDLLKANKTACKRSLSVMTYKVVALSQMSGIIEWCNDSLPLAAYLTGDGTKLGAHARYHPQDLPHRRCREALEKLHKVSAPASKKLAEYLTVCKKFQPVLRYFFLENFQSPHEWHSMQTNYTRSVGTSSMIGYILGLGDRHLNNILISLKTAQVIHIDFGIAFEQGLILPTPETVPFRLSRDVEDGMGATGTEGTFKKTCEATLSVLRDNSATLRTILEVLLYDPLYTWTLSPSKAAEKQKLADAKTFASENNVLVNKIAARALYRLEQKLQGIEEGSVFSVEGQASILIQRARDPDNLCRLYPGWQPYL